MARFKEALHIGIGGHVVALDAKSGEVVWQTKLKSQHFVSVMLRGNRVFAAAGGELFCLDAASGELLWHNKLKGLGMGFVSLSSSDDSVAAAAAAQAAAAQAAT